MPLNYLHPGVYVEEVPSGVHTITGVSTSITAFIGRAVRGEVNEPILISSFADFERTFGGLHVDYPMSYAVKDFFLNGGSQALIVRLFKLDANKVVEKYCAIFPATPGLDGAGRTGDPPATAAPPATVTGSSVPNGGAPEDGVPEGIENEPGESSGTEPGTFPVTDGAENIPAESSAREYDETESTLKLRASNPGTWGNKLSIKIDHEGLETNDVDFKMLLKRYGFDESSNLTNEHFFNLTVIEGPPYGTREIFRNITLYEKGGSRRIDRVLKQGSNLVRWAGGENSFPVELEKAKRPEKTHQKNDPTLSDTKSEDIKWFRDGYDSAGLTDDADYVGNQQKKTGMYALAKADLFNLLCIPPDLRNGDVRARVYAEAMKYCVDRRAMLIVDPPSGWKNADGKMPGLSELNALGLNGPGARNAAIYFPRVIQSDPLQENQLDTFVPCGIVAGMMAQTDSLRGVWKAPAGTNAALLGVRGLEVNLNDAENGQLNPLGINCLRSFPLYGHVAWGGRTLRGADQMADEYKYVPVRRLALYIEESLYRGLKKFVLEPNDEPLWRNIRTNVTVFMHDLFKLGAFQGNSPDQAYLVKCDNETTTQSDINKGIVNILVGFAPLKPAEFVVIKIQHLAGQLTVA